MNLTPRAANQLQALDSGDMATILDHLRDRPYGPGASLEEVQAVLGHANIATTARYLAQLLESEHPHG